MIVSSISVFGTTNGVTNNFGDHVVDMRVHYLVAALPINAQSYAVRIVDNNVIYFATIGCVDRVGSSGFLTFALALPLNQKNDGSRIKRALDQLCSHRNDFILDFKINPNYDWGFLFDSVLKENDFQLDKSLPSTSPFPYDAKYAYVENVGDCLTDYFSYPNQPDYNKYSLVLLPTEFDHRAVNTTRCDKLVHLFEKSKLQIQIASKLKSAYAFTDVPEQVSEDDLQTTQVSVSRRGYDPRFFSLQEIGSLDPDKPFTFVINNVPSSGWQEKKVTVQFQLALSDSTPFKFTCDAVEVSPSPNSPTTFSKVFSGSAIFSKHSYAVSAVGYCSQSGSFVPDETKSPILIEPKPLYQVVLKPGCSLPLGYQSLELPLNKNYTREELDNKQVTFSRTGYNQLTFSLKEIGTFNHGRFEIDTEKITTDSRWTPIGANSTTPDASSTTPASPSIDAHPSPAAPPSPMPLVQESEPSEPSAENNKQSVTDTTEYKLLLEKGLEIKRIRMFGYSKEISKENVELYISKGEPQSYCTTTKGLVAIKGLTNSPDSKYFFGKYAAFPFPHHLYVEDGVLRIFKRKLNSWVWIAGCALLLVAAVAVWLINANKLGKWPFDNNPKEVETKRSVDDTINDTTANVDTSSVVDTAALLLADEINEYLDGNVWRKAQMGAFKKDSLYKSVYTRIKERLDFNYGVRDALDNLRITNSNDGKTVQSLLEDPNAKEYLGEEKYNTLKAGLELTPIKDKAPGTILANLLGKRSTIPNLTFEEIKKIVDTAPRAETEKKSSGTADGSKQLSSPSKPQGSNSSNRVENGKDLVTCTCTKHGNKFAENTTLFSALQNPSVVDIKKNCKKHGKYKESVLEIQIFFEPNKLNYGYIYDDVKNNNSNHQSQYGNEEGRHIKELLEKIKNSSE